MKNAKEYKRRLLIAKEEESRFYETFNRWCGKEERARLADLLKRNKELVRTDISYGRVVGCDARCITYYEADKGSSHNYLISYGEIVCKIVYWADADNNTHTSFVKLWDGYSKTTLKHINAFLAMDDIKPLTKYDWVMLDSCILYDADDGEVNPYEGCYNM